MKTTEQVLAEGKERFAMAEAAVEEHKAVVGRLVGPKNDALGAWKRAVEAQEKAVEELEGAKWFLAVMEYHLKEDE